MSSIHDWASKAADYIHESYRPRNLRPTKERTAAVIATYAEPLIKLLRETERKHRHDALYHRTCCPQCTCQSNDYEAEEPNSDKPCDCGAAEWNEKIEQALSGV